MYTELKDVNDSDSASDGETVHFCKETNKISFGKKYSQISNEYMDETFNV